MTRPVLRAAAVLLVAAAALTAVRAEAVRLRPVGGIYGDSKDVGFAAPEGVALAGKDRLYVADTGNGRIVQFGISAEQAVAEAVLTFAEIPYPVRLAANSKGTVFVLDGKLRKIGKVVNNAFGGWVTLAAEGNVVPRALRVDGSDNLWVLDVAGARLLVLDGDGKLTRTVALPMDRGTFFSDVALDARGNAFLLDSLGRRVFVVKADAKEAAPFGPVLANDLDFATSLAIDGAGHVLVADQNGGGVVVLAADGTFAGRQSGYGWKEGLLRYPSAMAVDPGGRLFVADRGNNRVAVFGLSQ